MERIRRLLKVLEIVEKHSDQETADWFKNGVERYLVNRKRPSLEKSLDLASPGPGKPEPRRRFTKAERNRLIKEAFDLLDPKQSPTTRCDYMAKEIRDFQARIWPQWMANDTPPANSSEFRQLLFMAMKTGKKAMPSDWRSVWKVVFDF
jgi:hypothetical protein